MEYTNAPIPEPSKEVPERELTKKNGAAAPSAFKSILLTFAIILAAPITALLITSYVFQSYEVFGPSMQNTLHEGDRLIVVKAPRTWARIFNKDYQPNRGDVVVFIKRDLFIAGDSGNKQLIKRVIALPGERVVVKDGIVTVYNAEHPEGFQPDKEGSWSDTIQPSSISGEWTVGPGEIFVCGDNRNNSLDSRTFGPIAEHELVGIATFRFMPANQAGAL